MSSFSAFNHQITPVQVAGEWIDEFKVQVNNLHRTAVSQVCKYVGLVNTYQIKCGNSTASKAKKLILMPLPPLLGVPNKWSSKIKRGHFFWYRARQKRKSPTSWEDIVPRMQYAYTTSYKHQNVQNISQQDLQWQYLSLNANCGGGHVFWYSHSSQTRCNMSKPWLRNSMAYQVWTKWMSLPYSAVQSPCKSNNKLIFLLWVGPAVWQKLKKWSYRVWSAIEKQLFWRTHLDIAVSWEIWNAQGRLTTVTRVLHQYEIKYLVWRVSSAIVYRAFGLSRNLPVAEFTGEIVKTCNALALEVAKFMKGETPHARAER